jgi:O-succinylbenzoic acid--CoA ligase
MEQPLTYLKQCANDHWLIGCGSDKFRDLAEQLFQALIQQTQSGTLPKILLVEPDPVRFLAGFVAACAANCPVFLGNPAWVKREWQQVFDLVQPDLIWGSPPDFRSYQVTPQYRKPGGAASKGWIMIPTGGSSGKIRFAIHTWETLMASVQGFKQYFQLNRVNSFCVLPLYHVSGLMQFMRSFTSGGQLVILPFKTLESGEGCHVDPVEFFLSLVPTQLQRLLEHQDAAGPASTWLSRFQTVLLGGAPAWPELLERARCHRIRLALTYGMTETASQIATLKPDTFLSGSHTCGQVLPHAEVTIQSRTGELLGANQTGIITIKTAALALGYYPVGAACPQDLCFIEPEKLQLDDLGFFDSQGYLHVVGRKSHKIITGGENVFSLEVESAIRATNLVADICVIGVSDQDWGEVVTAIYTPHNPKLSTSALQTAIADQLSRFKQPKYWIPVERLPRNSQGKINREQLQQMVKAWQQNHSAG